jgi:hypothetical protein
MEEKIYKAKSNTPVVRSHRSFRRYAKKLLASLLKRQDQKFKKDVMQELQDIKETLEIMAREMARQLKR